MVCPCGSKTVVFNMTQTCAFIAKIIAAPPNPPPHENPPDIFAYLQAAKTPHENSAPSIAPAAAWSLPATPHLNIPSADQYETFQDRPWKASPQFLASQNPAKDDRSG